MTPNRRSSADPTLRASLLLARMTERRRQLAAQASSRPESPQLALDFDPPDVEPTLAQVEVFD